MQPPPFGALGEEATLTGAQRIATLLREQTKLAKRRERGRGREGEWEDVAWGSRR